MNTFYVIGIVVFCLVVLNSLLMAPGLARHARRLRLPGWIGWVPIVNTIVVPRAADASLLSWLLLFIPIVNIYVWWDWWGEVAFDFRQPRPDLFAAGMFVPGLSAILLRRV